MVCITFRERERQGGRGAGRQGDIWECSLLIPPPPWMVVAVHASLVKSN